MLQVGKLIPFPKGKPIRCAAKGFTVEQHSKQRLRPVFEPLYNPYIRKCALPPLKFPHRRERRGNLAGFRYFIQFDFSAFFDQIELHQDAHDHHVTQLRNPFMWEGEQHTLFASTRTFMGGTHAVHCSQTITWALLEPIILVHRIYVSTIIDNVAIASNDPKQFIEAVKTFFNRCDQFNFTVNDRDNYPHSDADILDLGMKGHIGPTVFLGEEYRNGQVCNTSKNVEKLKQAFERIQRSTVDNTIIVTKRNMAAVISLAIWMCQTLDTFLSHHFDVVRLYAQIEDRSGGWDQPIQVTGNMLNILAKIVGPLLQNRPVRPTVPLPPSCSNSDYEYILIVDACRTGWGAIAFHAGSGRMIRVRQGFHRAIDHSAWSEPRGALMLLQFLRVQPGRKIAVVTDHFALAAGQRRPLSGSGGFSRAYHLTAFFDELYKYGHDSQVFYVPGELNPADPISRATTLGQPLSWEECYNQTIPPLASFYHPYAEELERKWWHVEAWGVS
jgi:hypothetical protein